MLSQIMEPVAVKIAQASLSFIIFIGVALVGFQDFQVLEA